MHWMMISNQPPFYSNIGHSFPCSSTHTHTYIYMYVLWICFALSMHTCAKPLLSSLPLFIFACFLYTLLLRYTIHMDSCIHTHIRMHTMPFGCSFSICSEISVLAIYRSLFRFALYMVVVVVAFLSSSLRQTFRIRKFIRRTCLDVFVCVLVGCGVCVCVYVLAAVYTTD